VNIEEIPVVRFEEETLDAKQEIFIGM